ncbi:hypothetical protein P9A48_gp28 [Xanthomonas phage Mallos]|uniref:Uncharacterized protein n=1 Tax=Xanthomonas phage Mallos TaxID=2939131 RepID=A0A9E7J5E6_9CAUD|nr:hypothetical protein P9A48_gp28 [Xanthomonas phage Mallos]URA07136.1 hypothetical protein Mallos_BL60028 [Xanthomonas phage Mallos]
MTTIVQQKQETKNQRFVLVGPHTGKTINVNGHPFVDGEYTFQGPAHQVESLAKIFKRYSALPVEQAEAYQLDYIKANGSEDERKTAAEYEADKAKQLEEQRKTEGAPVTGDPVTGQPAADGVTHAQALDQQSGQAPGSEDPTSDGSGSGVGSQAHDANPTTDPVKPTLEEAIGSLDPEVDAHWTSNNLPAIDTLSELTGKAVTRAEVNAVADGYTRAKARAAKQ